jgi:DNA-directed RNA polymerase specialized sigma24 family protein
LIDCNFIKEYDSYINFCIHRYTSKPIDDYKQDIYLALLTHDIHNGNIKAYIFRIVRNYFYSIYRQRKFILKETDLPSVTNSPELHLIYKDVLNNIDRLSHGECLKLYSIGFKYREIAEKLHISMGSVKTNIYRLRKMLQR